MIRTLMFAFAIGWATSSSTAAPPNILFILADDLGWRDLGCTGGTLAETPRLDQLASEGMRFSQAYAPAPICSASRAAFWTGRSPARLGFEFVTKPADVAPPAREVQPPPYTRDLPLSEITLAETLLEAGYHTAFMGKWHLNEHYQRYLGWSPLHGPAQQGFELTVDTFGAHPYNPKAPKKPDVKLAKGTFPQDELTDAAIQYLKQSHDKPFLLCLSLYHVHTPVRSPAAWLLEKYAPRVRDLPGDPDRNAQYAAFIETLDHLVGRVLDALKESGRDQDTLVVFTSDNGGHPEYAHNAPLRGSKWNLYEAGIRVPAMVRWPGHIPAGVVNDWPIIGMDWYPTLCAAAGAKLPDVRLDGLDLLPWLKDFKYPGFERSLLWHFPYYHPEKGYETSLQEIGVNDFAVSQTHPMSAMRVGASKVHLFHDDGRLEWYHLPTDPSESHNLAPDRPQQAQVLKSEIQRLLKLVGARLPTTPQPQ